MRIRYLDRITLDTIATVGQPMAFWLPTGSIVIIKGERYITEQSFMELELAPERSHYSSKYRHIIKDDQIVVHLRKI